MAAWIFLRTSFGSISSQRLVIFFFNSAVKVHDSQAYRNIEMTKERISFTFDSRDTLLSLQIGFSFIRAAVACGILERISGLEPSSETTAPRFLKHFMVPYFCPFIFISLWMPLALFIISLVFSALISILHEPSLFFSNYLFSLGFKPIQDDFQHDCARMTDEADSYVVLAELQVALFRECNNQRLSPWGRPFSCHPDPVTDLC